MGERGASLGRYQLGRYLGRGGMGEVYLARAHGPSGFQKRVAIKILPERHVADAERSRRLLWEALVSCQLDHANIVSVLDAGEDDGRPYVVMEYVRGHSLATLLEFLGEERESMRISAAVYIARCVARALAYIHQLPSGDNGPCGLIHGDVSPSNVLVGGDGRVKLGDFGVARSMSDLDESVAGKLGYLSDEAFSGRPPRPAWDVYALACSLYQVLTGSRPFAGESFGSHQRALAAGAAPVRERRPDCPPALAELVDRAIGRDVDARFETADALLAALDHAAPPAGHEVETFGAYVSELFDREAFVCRYGELPSTGSISATFTRVPPRELEITPTTPSALVAPLRFGLSPALGAELGRQYGAELGTYLGSRLGRAVLTTVFADYSTLSEAVISGEVDVGWMPPLELMAVVHHGGGALVGARRGGHASYRSAVFVRTDSKVRGLGELAGASFAWVDRRSASGYAVARAMVVDAMDGAEALGREHFHGSHRAVCEAVLNGWADAGATYAHRGPEGDIASAGWIDVLGDQADQLRAVELSPPIPCDGIAHRPGFRTGDRSALRNILLAMSDDADGLDLLTRIFHAESLGELPDDVAYAVRGLIAERRPTTGR